MATQAEVATGYDPIDRIHEAAFGTFADVTAAFYDGDTSLDLRQAQSKKHDFVFSSLALAAGDTLLDIGCGWGPLLDAARARGIVAEGVTLSPAQVRRCRREGLDARLQDWREMDPAEHGPFAGVASLGAFEHFASPAEYLAGEQDRVYDDFFRLCAALLPEGGRLFLQTMTWGDRVPDPSELDPTAPRLSDPWVMGHLSYLYPGAWLPEGLDHLERCAAPYFRLEYESCGRDDYLRTMAAWSAEIDRLGWRKWWAMAPLMVQSLVHRDRRRLFTSLRHGCARICFERRIFSHYRTVFARR